jgi:16S rRNA (uracil1498-N3)-methyltransferase
MNLFYVPNFSLEDPSLLLPQQESTHVSRVLRKKIGDQIHVTNGKGLLALAEIGPSKGNEIQLKLIKVTVEASKPYMLHLYVAPTKMNERFEWFLEKATEIGISSITPIICTQSERKVIKPERYEKVLLSAMKQSLQSYLPLLKPAISLSKLLELPFKGHTYIAHCDPSKEKIGFNNQNLKNQTIHLLIGPEGDFSTLEITKALAKGFKAVSFGSTRLRTETAAIYATASVAAQNENYES